MDRLYRDADEIEDIELPEPMRMQARQFGEGILNKMPDVFEFVMVEPTAIYNEATQEYEPGWGGWDMLAFLDPEQTRSFRRHVYRGMPPNEHLYSVDDYPGNFTEPGEIAVWFVIKADYWFSRTPEHVAADAMSAVRAARQAGVV